MLVRVLFGLVVVAHGLIHLLGFAKAFGLAPISQLTLPVGRLPSVVQSWLRGAGVIGRAAIRTVHLEQTGRMRTKPDGSWMEVQAEQRFTIRQPGFLWRAEVALARASSSRAGTSSSTAGGRIPARSSVTWNLEEGEFTWFELELTAIVYDPDPFVRR